jgi:hypothetical protein
MSLNLHDVEQCGDARGDVLAECGGGREKGVVVGHNLAASGATILGQLVLEVGAVGEMDPCRHRRSFAAAAADAIDAFAGDEQMDFAELRGGGYGCEGRVLDCAVGMFDQLQASFMRRLPAS